MMIGAPSCRFFRLFSGGKSKPRPQQTPPPVGHLLTTCLTSRFQLDSALDVRQLLERCPAQMTGADLYALCSDAMTAAIMRKIRLIEDGTSTDSLSRLPVIYLAARFIKLTVSWFVHKLTL